MPLVIPLLAFGAAYTIIRGATAVQTTDDTSPSDSQPTTSVAPSTGSDWSFLIGDMRGDVNAEFIRRWIARESDGNPCAIGVYGGPWEVGIGQVYYDVGEFDKSIFGSSARQLRQYCNGSSQALVRELTDEERRNQMYSLVEMAKQYISIARNRLSAIGAIWSDEDVQCLAKLYHALPILVTNHLSVAAQDGMTDSWDSYRSYLGTMTRDEVLAVDSRAGYTAGQGAARKYPLDSKFANAQSVGRGD